MSNAPFSFLILHYNELTVTTRCVESIKANTIGNHIHIVIVDNASPDGSGQKLSDLYQNDSQITVLLSKQNLGFAKGNNLGYSYIKNNLKSDYICIMNNDVLLLQNDFISRITAEYNTSKAGIIGPHITLLNGNTNYMYLKIHSRAYFEHELQFSKTMYRYYSSKLYPIRNVINQSINKISNLIRPKKESDADLNAKIDMAIASKKRHKNIVLHGCCLILTPKYISAFDDAFNDKTFMFREEELLYLRCKRHDIQTIYEPTIDILHLEDMSTNATYKKNNKREAFKFKCQIDSLKILLDELC